MYLPDDVISELVQSWIRLHGVAAPMHLLQRIAVTKQSGDAVWEAIYRRILEAMTESSCAVGLLQSDAPAWLGKP